MPNLDPLKTTENILDKINAKSEEIYKRNEKLFKKVSQTLDKLKTINASSYETEDTNSEDNTSDYVKNQVLISTIIVS